MRRRGISAVIATVLLILITVAAISVLWIFILPMVDEVSTVGGIVSLEIV